jgi:dolichyl-phosphate beta-glucosyltransferase
MNAPSLSVVIPAFNEERRLPPTLRSIGAYLAETGLPHEIVVVDDGSSDRTAELVQEITHGTAVLVRNERNRGKGAAVRRGMLVARGERRLLSDADLSTPIEELARLMAQLDAGADVAVGSRAAAGARIEVHQTFLRENSGRLFNLAVRLLVVPGIADTQCGFKLFSGRAAQEIFAACRVDGFCFDVEALFVARRRGLRIAEVPVVWRNDTASRVTLLRGALAFWDLLRIRAWGLRGVYRPGGVPASL